MNLGEVKQLLYEIVASYHQGAVIVWEKTKGVTPKPPYITLGYNNLKRSLFSMSDDEGKHKYYNYSFTFEINLYTIGKQIKLKDVSTGAYENTAVEDLEEFIRFLDSEEMTDELAKKGVTIIINSPVRDLSELIGNTKFHYRSMSEFIVTFVGTADGKYGVAESKTVPNSSGGGLKEFMQALDNVIEEVEINEV